MIMGTTPHGHTRPCWILMGAKSTFIHRCLVVAQVKLPNVNWQAVFDEPASMLQRVPLGRGYEKVLLPEGLSAYVVDNAEHAEDAIKKLRASMQVLLVQGRGLCITGIATLPGAQTAGGQAGVQLLLSACCVGVRAQQTRARMHARGQVQLCSWRQCARSSAWCGHRPCRLLLPCFAGF